MKVLQINAVYNLSSTGRTSTELHHALLEKGIDSYVAYSTTNRPDDENLYVIGNKNDRKLHAFLSRLTGKQAYYSTAATKKLLKYIDSLSPDIVHIRNLHGNYVNMPMLLKYLAEKNIATVATLHDFFFLTGKCVYFTSAECNKWQTGCGKCPNLQNGNRTWLFDRTAEMFADKKKLFGNISRLAFVGVSKWVAEEASKSPIARNATVTTSIYNWIDFDCFKPLDVTDFKKEAGLDSDFIILGVSAIWETRKGLDRFLELSKHLSKNEKILLIGDMPDGIELPENIISVSKTDSVEELVRYYNCADVFLTFSLEETFGKVSAEALSCGTPVICYNSTANPELVGERCGYVVEKNNFDGIVDAIAKVKQHGRAYYSESCIAYSHENFDKQKNIDKYIELYEKLING